MMTTTPNPSEEQIEKAARAFFREYHGEDIWPELRDDGELDTRSRALAATRAALVAAQGAAPQVESDERIQAWERLIQHPVWRSCFEEERPLIDSVMERIDNLAELEMTVNELAPAPVLPSSTAPQVESEDNVMCRCGHGTGSHDFSDPQEPCREIVCDCRGWFGVSPVLPSSGVDEDKLAEAWEAGCLAGKNRKHHTNITQEQAEKAWPNPYRGGQVDTRG